MKYRWKTISSLEKIFFHNFDALKEETHGSMFKNEIYSFQLAGEFKNTELVKTTCKIEIESEIAPYISLYSVGYVPNDLPTIEIDDDDEYLTKEPGLFPDPLFRIRDNTFTLCDHQVRGVWVCTEPKGEISGCFDIKLKIYDKNSNHLETLVYSLKIIDTSLPEQRLINTGWFHGDCIALLHNTEIGSKEYFSILEKYLKVYVKFGHNMILTPMFTPPIDTAVGKERLTNQLVCVRVNDGKYSFDFSPLKKWMNICSANGIKYFEFSHLFTQWGAKYAPKIMAYDAAEYKRIFGWETKGDSAGYIRFLEAFLPRLVAFLKEEKVFERCFFHISDEPDGSKEHKKRYGRAKDLIVRYIPKDRIFDTIDEYSYYKEGIINCPIVAIDRIKDFTENNVPRLWAYYCMAQRKNVANRFLAQPSYRNRILGLQLYKYNIEGFLQWGFNFWLSAGAQKVIDPYKNTTADMSFPGGDPFVVYPLDKFFEVVCSLRLYVFNEALQDMRALYFLEQHLGRDNVLKLLSDIDGFEVYPKNEEYILNLRSLINRKAEEIING